MSYAGMAANIVGGELQGWASVLARQQMFDTFRNEMRRQGGYQQQGADIFNRAAAQSGVETARSDMEKGYGQRMASYDRAAQAPLAIGGTGAEATRAADEAYGNMLGQLRAKLGAYGDWSLEKTIRDTQTQNALNQLSNFAGGTASVYPYRMYGAQHSQDTLNMIGQAISSIGGSAANYAQFASQPQAQPQPRGVQAGGALPAYWSGYGGGVPYGTSYNPYSDQNTFFPVGYGQSITPG